MPACTVNTGPAFAVNAGAFTEIAIVGAGRNRRAGTTTGKTGTPGAQNTDSPSM